MKWLLILFATYMLLLPCIPCNAAEVCCVEEQVLSAVRDCCPEEEKDCAEEDHSCPEEERSCPAEEGDCPAEENSYPEEDHSCPAEERSCPAEKHSCPEAPAEDKEHHEHSPICPCCPSFSCNTCHSLVISEHFLLEEPGIPILNFDNVLFTDGPLANFSALIWQPPRCLC